jgi:hypothetical protein
MQPDHQQSLDQIGLNRAPMITEDEPEPGKGPLDTNLTAGKPCDNQLDLSDRKARNGRKPIGSRDYLSTLPLPETGRRFPRGTLSETREWRQPTSATIPSTARRLWK